MNLSPADREWVGAIVKQAASDTLNASRDFTRQMVEAHPKSCPNVARLKWMLMGLGIGLGISFPQIADAVIRLVKG